jgi:gamma-glutamyl-gamma-aminobutyrate hydrolase PuuD
MEQTSEQKKTVIGIVTMPKNEKEYFNFSEKPDSYILGQLKNFIEDHNNAKVVPVRFDLSAEPEKLQQTLDSIDGVLFTGGFLAIKSVAERTDTAKAYLKTAMEILKYSIAHNMPILGICQGY